MELTGCEKCIFYTINWIFFIIFAGIPAVCGFYSIAPLQSTVITAFGKIIDV
jgi:hypothetical protein